MGRMITASRGAEHARHTTLRRARRQAETSIALIDDRPPGPRRPRRSRTRRPTKKPAEGADQDQRRTATASISWRRSKPGRHRESIALEEGLSAMSRWQRRRRQGARLTICRHGAGTARRPGQSDRRRPSIVHCLRRAAARQCKTHNPARHREGKRGAQAHGLSSLGGGHGIEIRVKYLGSISPPRDRFPSSVDLLEWPAVLRQI